MRRIAAAIVLALCGGCAAQSKAREDCVPLSDDFALIGQPVYRDCAVDRKARPLTMRVPLNYTPSGRQACGRVSIDVVVDSTGRPATATARVVRSNDPTFGAAVLASLEATRFQPAQKDGRPVAQLVRYERAYAVRTVVVGGRATRATSRTPSRPPC